MTLGPVETERALVRSEGKQQPGRVEPVLGEALPKPGQVKPALFGVVGESGRVQAQDRGLVAGLETADGDIGRRARPRPGRGTATTSIAGPKPAT